MDITQDWDLEQLLGYLSTWSAVRRIEAAGRQRILRDFGADLAALWGDPSTTRRISWPVTMRLARL